MERKRPPLKLIVWEDAYNGDHDWVPVDEIPDKIEPMVMRTVGFEIRRDKERVVLSMTYGRENYGKECPLICDVFCIPVGMIKEEKTLNG